jgi:hypothetical protein
VLDGRACIERVVGGIFLPLLLMTEWLLLVARPFESGTGVDLLLLFGIGDKRYVRLARSCSS